MKVEGHTKQCAMLDAEEASLRARLLAILPGVAADGAQLSLNSSNSPVTTARYSHEEADDLSDTGPCSPSAQSALVIALSDRHTPRAQDVVCGDGVEIEVG
jgi:hypothetical protein